jgi:ATP-dependent DNA ligase
MIRIAITEPQLTKRSPPRCLHKIPPVGFVRLCEPALVVESAAGPGRLHEVKHDGVRILGWKQGQRVKVWSRRGADFTDRLSIADGLAASPAIAR